jgi:catechol 2,3-dioxygenase-like lactoylglutathione lyase family enzyme
LKTNHKTEAPRLIAGTQTRDISLCARGERIGCRRIEAVHMSESEEVEPRVNVITLGVKDLERALAFYREGLGLESEGVTGTDYPGDEENPAGDLAMFHLEGGLILALYPRTELVKDAQVPFQAPKSGEFSIGHLVPTRAQVDALLMRAQAAGATLTGPAHDRPWGIYSGYFHDLDGHLWEIIWNSRQ